MPEITIRWMYRYKTYFIILILFLAIQLFLAYKSSMIPQLNIGSGGNNFLQSYQANSLSNNIKNSNNDNSVGGDDEDLNIILKTKETSKKHISRLNLKQLGFEPECKITTKEAISALNRAKTQDCKKHIANITCLIQNGKFYRKYLNSTCPNHNFTANRSLGCYKDEKEYRLLSGYYTNFKLTNSPHKCIQMCLQSGFSYAGVQYSTECFCGNDMPKSKSKLSDPNCNMKCPGDPKKACGGYYTINIYETGISKFTPQPAELIPKDNVEKVKIAFLLTLNGRALRQVYRLIKALYSPNHVFYIHVDSRHDYLYRELLKLETKFSNIRLARTRFSTIWGGASLLTMLLQCMKDLLQNSNWQWDFVINLSESDFPVKTNDKLVDFLTANRNKNFIKSHGRETQRFVQKQGLDKTFVECETHMWRIGDRTLPEGIQIDGGSDWIALSKNFVEYVTNYENNDLLLGLIIMFRHTLLPAESFFHTVLRNSNFCNTYIDNNLHVTNWKRKLGCKCQYKHVVDWCGCSPNDFKPEDWSRLQSTEHKLLFFARKFEPIINQAIILQLEEWLFGSYTIEMVNLNSYWQSLYHYDDKSPADDAALTIATSLMRLNGRLLNFEPIQLKEITNFKIHDEYKGFVIRYSVKYSMNSKSIELETRIRPNRSSKTAINTRFGKRIKNFEISSDYDQKERLSRNIAKFLGPFVDPVLTFEFIGSEQAENYSYNITVLWIDPGGRIQDFNEIHIEDSQTDSINYAKPNLKHPLTPGIWTVKLIGRTALFAYAKFLIVPILFEKSKPIEIPTRSELLYLGSEQTNIKYPSEWQQYLIAEEDVQLLQELIIRNSKRTGDSLISWIDGLVSKFFFIRETCTMTPIETNNLDNKKLILCNNTDWSTIAPDPKSDIYSVLNKTN